MKCHKELKSTKMQNSLPGTLSFSLNLLLPVQHFRILGEKVTMLTQSVSASLVCLRWRSSEKTEVTEVVNDDELDGSPGLGGARGWPRDVVMEALAVVR